MRGTFALDITVGPRGMRKDHVCDLVIVPPLVTGTMTRLKSGDTVRAKGYFVQTERQATFSPPYVKGRLTLVLRTGTEMKRDFDTHYWGTPAKVAHLFLEGLGLGQSDDLLRRLIKILVGAEEDLDETRRICARLAQGDRPEDLLRHAEELWNQARLLLLLGKEEEDAVACAVEGAERVRGCGLEPGPDMTESGFALADVLDVYRRPEAARRVRDALDTAEPAEGR